MKDNARNNSIANLVSRCWSIIANFLFVPVYIQLLGPEAYGLTTFFATLQVVLNLLGLGLSQTLRREFASHDGVRTPLYKYKLLRSVELIYWCIALLIIAFCICTSNFIATSWLQANGMNVMHVCICISLMGVSIAFQLLANLYFGGLMGLSEQVSANFLQVLWSVVKNCGVIAVLLFTRKSVLFYFGWFAICDVAYFLINRIVLTFQLHVSKPQWKFADLSLLRGIYKYAIGIIMISIGYAINTQVDKLIISHNFDLLHVGAYNTTFSMSYLTSIIASSIAIAMFPIFTNLFTAQKLGLMKKRFLQINKVVNVGTLALGVFLATYSYELLLVWTRNEDLANVMRSSAFLVVLGTTLTTLEDVPYNYLLAHGKTLPNNIQTFCCLAYVVIITPILIRHWGLYGAAVAWFVEMGLSTCVYLLYFYLTYFKEDGLKYFCIYTLGPICVSCALAQGSYHIMKMIVSSPFHILIGGVVCGTLSLLIETALFAPSYLHYLNIRKICRTY